MLRLPRNEKQTYRLNSRPQMRPKGLTSTITLTFELWRSNVTLTFDHTHDLDHGFSWSNFEIAVSQIGRANWYCTKEVAVGHSWPWPWPFSAKVRCMDLPDSDRGDFSCRRAVDSSSYKLRLQNKPKNKAWLLYLAITSPADCITRLNARVSADTVMIKVESGIHVNTGPAIQVPKGTKGAISCGFKAYRQCLNKTWFY